MRVLIFGGTGQLGASLTNELKEMGYDVKIISRKKCNLQTMDLAMEGRAEEIICEYKPSKVINLIALTSVDECEVDKKMANIVNKEISKKIAFGCRINKARLIHISTDQVYSLDKYNSESDYRPINVYGLTKYQGEVAALLENKDSLILRTNFIGKDERKTPKSLVDWMVDTMNKGEELKVFKDVRFNPLNTRDLCKLIGRTMDQNLNGVYNLGSRGELTKYGLAVKLRDAMQDLDIKIRGISVEELHLKAKRPKCMVMDVAKFEKDFNIKLPDIEETLEKTVQELL